MQLRALAQSRRIDAARTVPAWRGLASVSARKWLAWNVRNDDAHDPASLAAVDAELAAQFGAGPELLRHAQGALAQCRPLDALELGHVPELVFNHVRAASIGKAWLRVGPADDEPDFSEGSLIAEGARASVQEAFEVEVWQTRPKWVTFPASRQPLPSAPDEVVQKLGLAWQPVELLRVTIPKATLGAWSWPTLFDGLYFQDDLASPDWRARPPGEQTKGEPWGRARDMRTGKAALPELLAVAPAAVHFTVTSLGRSLTDWSTRPFLAERP